MAHLVVALERGPRGIHPASAVALCLARDFASLRGATVTAVCEGEEAAHDALVVQAAGRFGADMLVFVGPEGLRGLCQRLTPKYVLGAATAHSVSLLRGVGRGDPTVRWFCDPADNVLATPADATADRSAGTCEVLAVHAAVPAWVDLQTTLEADYEVGAGQANLPVWLTSSSQWPRRPQTLVHGGPLAADERTHAELSLLSARAYDPAIDDEAIARGETWLVWLGEEVPPAFAQADSLASIILVPGISATPESPGQPALSANWGHAQFVLAGRPDEAIRQLHHRTWRDHLAL